MLLNKYDVNLSWLMLLCGLFFTSVSQAVENDAENYQRPQQFSALNDEYHLGPGDLLKITVFNQESLSGDYIISGNGQLSFPLIGTVAAKDLTVKQLQQTIVDKLKPDYLLNPRVSIQVLNYRPFYILGEVKQPQSYPYVDGMTYLNAVAIAGGYTYRAKEDYVMVIRMNDSEKEEVKRNMDDKVMPGDVIRVKQRFF
ncbi:MAG: polysaccharide biosynthesis/export family protein [Gammaproteobacteria bacterium]